MKIFPDCETFHNNILDKLSLLLIDPNDENLIKKYANFYIQMDDRLFKESRQYDLLNKYITPDANVSDLTEIEEFRAIATKRLIYLMILDIIPVGVIGVTGYNEKSEYQYEWSVRHLVVDEKYTKMGVASKALELLFNIAKKAKPKVKVIVLGVLEPNVPARKLYDKVGFVGYSRHLIKLL